ncbi:hypothetical protein MHBO_005027 [Bonamia ostreae]|uniref:Uncharacterized protein n=1 Tax=Bonamia ostreae TaxID=126728 RepID=A0ABV2AUZ1_9EUKA
MRKAFFVQPLNKKRAMLRGKCVYFNAKEKEAAVRREHSSWPPIGFIVPDVLLDLIDRGKTLLFNVDFTANLKPFVVNLRVE